ncbi:hypothetical protein GB931_06220 [Modestobacter sp. I12A-02628]|uniref:Uncharacterized protein n=1 Tax=Goekera deserti TaxID=2497753 RepID=A0A7K3WCW5_9ACTN|nr:hypothetical protein [Goekera deserti]MPQ97524.1 hypothetical protein [Goekera deserti]NDI47872.1 hypothetical protein [Goekera deserti]NEL53620.1 hypothetical protein [Goekera deserti]
MSLLDRLRRRLVPPPEAVRTVLAASPDPYERVLAVATLDPDGWLVATSRGLREVPAAVGAADAAALPVLRWHEVGRATWKASAAGGGSVTVVPLTEVEPGVQTRGAAVRHLLTDAGQLPAVLRRRVDETVVASQRHPLPTGGSVLLVARRVPGQPAREWSVVFDDDADRADPEAREAARARLAAAVEAEDPTR